MSEKGKKERKLYVFYGRYGTELSKEEAEEILKKEVGSIFERVLEDAGVFKNDINGMEAFQRFMLNAGFGLLDR